MAFFGGMPFPVQFFLAFVIVLGLIGATAWAVRRFGAGALGSPSMRGRQPRLAVLEHTLVEGRRRLYLVRRDNVEHLLLIGGPTDIVVEPNIVRAVAPPRDTAVARPTPAMDALTRAIPLPDSPPGGAWPLQPEPAAPPAPPAAPRAPRHEPTPEEPAAWPLQPHNENSSRAPRDTLAALADELATRSAPRNRPQPNPRHHGNEPRPEPRPEPRGPSAQYVAPESAEAADQSLAEMAHRLEAALRAPNAKADGRDARPPVTLPRPAPLAAETAPAEPNVPAPQPPLVPPRAARAADANTPRSDGKQPGTGKALYDNLEQEMASLLGRPPGKT